MDAQSQFSAGPEDMTASNETQLLGVPGGYLQVRLNHLIALGNGVRLGSALSGRSFNEELRTGLAV